MKPPKGFTLLEVLVAMAILVVIVLIVSNIFHHSRMAWDSGMRKTAMSMEGRSALSLISKELAFAVAHGPLTNAIAGGGLSTFYTYGSFTNGERIVRLVSYRMSGDAVQRSVQYCDPSAPTYPPPPAYNYVTLIEGVRGFAFTVPSNIVYRSRLPEWVDVHLQMEQGGKYSIIQVTSDGPDRTASTADDIQNTDTRL